VYSYKSTMAAPMKVCKFCRKHTRDNKSYR